MDGSDPRRALDRFVGPPPRRVRDRHPCGERTPGVRLHRRLGGEPEEIRLRTSPGDYIFVPPFVPHREENPDPAEEAVVVIARSTQEAIVVNLPGLDALRPDGTH